MQTQALRAKHCQKMETNPTLPYVMGVKRSCPDDMSKGFTTFFKRLIADHHRLFKHLSPIKKLLPKQHFMVH